jgi:hypothetical protein
MQVLISARTILAASSTRRDDVIQQCRSNFVSDHHPFTSRITAITQRFQNALTQLELQLEPLLAPLLRPQLVPQLKPLLRPQLVPLLRPQLVPQLVPLLRPQLRPQLSPQLVPPSKPPLPARPRFCRFPSSRCRRLCRSYRLRR